jgi:hypothetical protein
MQDETRQCDPSTPKAGLATMDEKLKAGLDAVVLADAVAVVVFQLAEDNGGKNG